MTKTDLDWMEEKGRLRNDTIDIFVIQNGIKVCSIAYPIEQWGDIGYIDYVDIDANNRVDLEYREAYGPTLYNRMQRIIDWQVF